MKLCDRCFKTDGSVSAAVESVTFGMSHEVIDVCLSCADDIKTFANKKEKDGTKRPGRPAGKAKKQNA